MEIWRGRVLWRGYIHSHPHPHTQLTKSGIPHTHTYTQSMRGFPVKIGRVRAIPMGMGLFAISRLDRFETFLHQCLTFLFILIISCDIFERLHLFLKSWSSFL